VEKPLIDISHTIQLAVAPVFLLSAIGTLLSVLTNRMSRVIDRARYLEAAFPKATSEDQRAFRRELDVLSKRARYIFLSLASGVASGLAVCLLITVAFVAYLFQTKLGDVVALLFILGMVLLVLALLNFLREVFLSYESLQFGLKAVPPQAPSSP
jgi:hypothetical protein